jgi:predicted patatin/cPLA2 family phospholipase
MIGIIDVSRNINGVFGAGVMDYLTEHDIRLDYGIGSSSGGTNLISYFAGQRGRSYLFYYDYASRREYLNIRNIGTENNVIDMDLLYDKTFSEFTKYPFAYDQTGKEIRNFYILATEADTGMPYYFDMLDPETDRLSAIKASYSIPVVNEPYSINEKTYYDGYISDPLPFMKAFSDGCDKVILITARPLSYRRDQRRDKILLRMLGSQYPDVAQQMKRLSDMYNTEIDLAINMQDAGRLLILAPESISAIQTILKDKKRITNLYNEGYHAAGAVRSFLNL